MSLSFTYNQPTGHPNYFVNETYNVIKDLYVFCHVKTYFHEDKDSPQDDNIEQIISQISMSTMIILLSFTIVKIAVLFLYFLMFNIIIEAGIFCCTMIRTKCSLNICAAIKKIFFYFSKIIKKFYTYNFYSFENYYYGGFCIVTYMLFLGFNFTFSIENIIFDIKESEMNFISLRIIAFELHILVELLCLTFYYQREIRKQLVLTTFFYLGLNLIIYAAVLANIQIQGESNQGDIEYPKRFAHLLYYLFFSTFSLCVIYRVFNYNVNKEAFQALLEEKKVFYRKNKNEEAESHPDEQNKLNEISKQLHLDGFYSGYENVNFFKRKDRYYHKKALTVLMIALFLATLLEMGYTITILINDQYKSLLWIQFTKKFSSMVHTLVVIMISWITYMKIGIRTQFLF